jgi:phosphoribosylamine--glycine ligase
MTLKVLVIGSGGREATLVWKIAQSEIVDNIYAAPGNGGISQYAECVNIQADEIDKLAEFAEQNSIDLTIVGPENPLSDGIVDIFEAKGLRIFGPTKLAAEIESSKVFAKDFMKKYNIPSAEYKVFTDPEEAKEYVRELGPPLVVKADGLAAGKGVIPAMDLETALEAVDKIGVQRAFGEAGNKIIVEEFLEGEEASILAFTDGETVVPMVSSQDHKRAYDGDKGPNTGGMGAYSPAPVMTGELNNRVLNEVLIPTVKGMKEEGRKYKGVLYAGLMIKNGKPKVLEFNCRFGDPELQVVLPRLSSDVIEPLNAVVDERLSEVKLEWNPQATVCVVMASEGYPGKYEKGKPITGLEKLAQIQDIIAFHAGTKREDDTYTTSGGRVLGVTAFGDDIKSAIDHVYQTIDTINFENAFYRKDIGHRALARLDK